MIHMSPVQPDLTKDEVKILTRLFDIKDNSKNELTKTVIKVVNEDAYTSMAARGLIVSTPFRNTYKYKISPEGTVYYEANKDALSSILSVKPVKDTKASQVRIDAQIISKLDALDKKIDERFDIIISMLSKTSSPITIKPDASDGLRTFEIALKEEYKKLRQRDFLGDGSVWHQELKKIVMSKYGYQDFQYDEMLQALKKARLGMIMMSQGKEKTWIEIRE